MLDFGETCDDNNTTPGDGCSDTCQSEPGYVCIGTPSTCTLTCGNGMLDPGETCDDNNTTPGDGCSDTCQSEPGYTCAGVPSTCTFTCGNGMLDPGETCDDNNTTPGDGCSDICQAEPGYSCSGAPSTCTQVATVTPVTTACIDTTGGTDLTAGIGDDVATSITALPFPFTLEGDAVSDYSVTSNGFLQLWPSSSGTPTLPAFMNTPIPDSAAPHGMVAPFWDDLVNTPTTTLRSIVTGTAPDRIFVIEWGHWARFMETSDDLTFQVWLHESGGQNRAPLLRHERPERQRHGRQRHHRLHDPRRLDGRADRHRHRRLRGHRDRLRDHAPLTGSPPTRGARRGAVWCAVRRTEGGRSPGTPGPRPRAGGEPPRALAGAAAVTVGRPFGQPRYSRSQLGPWTTLMPSTNRASSVSAPASSNAWACSSIWAAAPVSWPEASGLEPAMQRMPLDGLVKRTRR